MDHVAGLTHRRVMFVGILACALAWLPSSSTVTTNAIDSYDSARNSFDVGSRLSTAHADGRVRDGVSSSRTVVKVAFEGSASSNDFVVAANAGARALPSALSGGAADTYVYFGAKNGKNVYAGITNNLGRRQAEHGARFALDPITSAPVTRGQARSIEQALIVRNPGFQNVRNSISPNHGYYDDAVAWGESWLKQSGF